jgi:very-short-patch-repair endonuclease
MSPEQRLLATQLIAGPEAALSHITAARFHGLDVPRTALVDVTVPFGRHGSQFNDARIYRARDLQSSDVDTRHKPFRVTSVARTTLDLASVLNGDWLSALVYSVLRKNPGNANLLWLTLSGQGAGKRGARRLRRLLLRDSGEFGIPRSVAESFFRELVRLSGFTPQVQYRFGHKHTVDFSFPEHRLLIEVDSWTHHASFAAYRTDRQRDVAAFRQGWQCLRYTWHDVTQDRPRVVSELRDILTRRSPQHSLGL